MTKSLTIGIPCYNESITVGKVITDFRAVFPAARLLVIDNASTDGTADIARAHGAEVVSEPRKGKGYAVQRLFNLTESDYLIMVDGDDTYPAEEALKLIDAVEREGGDTVVGRRTSSETAAFKTAHTWANLALCGLIETIFSARCGDLFSGYRLFTRAFYRNVPMLAKGFEVETELAIQTIDKGFVQRDVNIFFRSRPEGSFSKLNTFSDGFRVIRVIITVVKDFKPMLFFTRVHSLSPITCGSVTFTMCHWRSWPPGWICWRRWRWFADSSSTPSSGMTGSNFSCGCATLKTRRGSDGGKIVIGATAVLHCVPGSPMLT